MLSWFWSDLPLSIAIYTYFDLLSQRPADGSEKLQSRKIDPFARRKEPAYASGVIRQLCHETILTCTSNP
jgi:hypothetical protein